MGQHCVLVVDDEIGLLNLFAGLVERLRYDVLRAHGGQAALDILAQQTPDVVILDLAMPIVSGTDVLRYICRQRHLDSTRVIVLTALGFTPDMDDVEGRIALWLTRPISPADFMNSVRRVAENHR